MKFSANKKFGGKIRREKNNKKKLKGKNKEE